MDRPNILWITTDQQRYDALGCMGNPHLRTPNLDRLAGEGALLRSAFVQNPVCTPSRASMLTGRYPRTTRCRQNGQTLPRDERLLPRILADAGYTCGLAGKLHLSACHPDVLNGKPERRVDDGYTVFDWHHDHWPWAAYGEWLRERGGSPDFTPIDGVRDVTTGPATELTSTAWACDCASRFITEHAEGPWFYSLNIFDPHHPFRIPSDRLKEWQGRVDSLPLPVHGEKEWKSKPIWQEIDHGGSYGGNGTPWEAYSENDHRWIKAAYYAMIEDIDTHVGNLLDQLERTGQAENTLVIFTSDHGELLGDHGIYLKGPHSYDCSVRVPLILRRPAHITAGLVSDALVELIDLAPTIMEATGLPAEPGMQGQSLTPLLQGKTETHRDDVLCEYYNANFHHEPRAWTTMIRTEDRKLVRAHGQPDGELYDLTADPNELENRWHDPAYREDREVLLIRLCDRMAWTTDPLPLREAAY